VPNEETSKRKKCITKEDSFEVFKASLADHILNEKTTTNDQWKHIDEAMHKKQAELIRSISEDSVKRWDDKWE